MIDYMITFNRISGNTLSIPLKSEMTSEDLHSRIRSGLGNHSGWSYSLEETEFDYSRRLTFEVKGTIFGKDILSFKVRNRKKEE